MKGFGPAASFVLAARYKDGRPHQAVETEALRQTVLQDILLVGMFSPSKAEEIFRRGLAKLKQRTKPAKAQAAAD